MIAVVAAAAASISCLDKNSGRHKKTNPLEEKLKPETKTPLIGALEAMNKRINERINKRKV